MENTESERNSGGDISDELFLLGTLCAEFEPVEIRGEKKLEGKPSMLLLYVFMHVSWREFK